MQDTALAQQLIDTVRRTVNAEAALVQDRVAYALHYIEQLDQPNGHAVHHVRRILTGGYDSMIALTAADKIENGQES